MEYFVCVDSGVFRCVWYPFASFEVWRQDRAELFLDESIDESRRKLHVSESFVKQSHRWFVFGLGLSARLGASVHLSIPTRAPVTWVAAQTR